MTSKNGTQQREIEYRRQCVKDAWIKLGAFGTTQQQIADALSADHGIAVDQATISRDLAAIKVAMQKQTPADLKSFLMAEYLFVINEARAAWLKSLEDAETTVEEFIKNGDINEADQSGAGRLKVSTRREGQSGNPALLGQAQNAYEAIRKMFGVDAAEKIDLKATLDHTFEQSLNKAYSDSNPDTS